MVLSNKKLKQKLRAELAKSLSESVAKADLNTESQTQSLKLLLDSSTQRPRLSKREKRRETFSLRGLEPVNGDNLGEEDKKESGSEGKKRKRKREGNDVVLVSEENGVVKKSKTKKKKKKNSKKKKAKNEEGKELGNEEQMVVEPNEKNDVNSQANGNVTTKVYVGGIPFYSTEDDIRSYFEGCGTITEVDCMTFPESGKFRGISIISFKTEAAAKRALALDGSDMGGLFLTIQPYNANQINKKSDFAPEIVEGYNRIYVGNLAWDITEDKLKNFFSDCKVSSIRFGMDKETGEFRGYAHVDFSDSLSLTMALKLDQKVVCGRPARIRCAVPLKKMQTNTRSVPRTTETAPTTTETTDTNAVSTSVASTGKMKRRSCYECGEKGHISSDCPKKKTASSTVGVADSSKQQITPTTTEIALTATKTADTNSGSTSVVSTGKMKRRSCYECGEKGHISSDCPKKQTAGSTDATADCPKNQTDPPTTETALTTAEAAPTTMKTANTISGSTPVVSAGKIKRRTCYECGGKGHISSDCPKKQTAGS
ncbi:28 kDa ribonucleoprotein [Morus notabilis]|uniref:28 kDa ribonucleoprotein n=1 Tax=Morus notabilis TaxID=981085 RepID=W9RQS5_9ROSA|nr:nucleolin 2 [Morus notabilis]EXB65318.1 28 kDa ribonucleoprotein [Morus notabilis]